MKMGLLSDVHAAPEPVLEALQIFRKEAVDVILCAGDIAGYGQALGQTVALLSASGCQAILGNHDIWHLERAAERIPGLAEKYLEHLPVSLNIEAAGKHLHMIHASPPDSQLDGIRLLDEEGVLIPAQKAYWCDALATVASEVLVVGHTHQVFAEQLDGLLVINPGSTLFNHTCAILTLPGMTVEFFALSGKKPVLSWNFGMLRQSH